MNVNYNPDARCYNFMNFLMTICSNDKSLAKFLAIIFGTCMIKRKEEIAYIFHGYGSNGKTTLLAVAIDILGDYVREGNITLVTAREDEGKNPEFVASVDKNLVVIDEPIKITIKGSLLKAIISNGKRSARTLNALPKEYEKRFNLIISTNPKPYIDDNTEGTYRKLSIIPFRYSIPREKTIPNYHEELLNEREGIFNLFLIALEEYLKVKNIQKMMPEAAKRYTNDIIWERDHIKEFVDRYLEREDVNTPFKVIYEAYLEFCKVKKIDDEIKLSKRALSNGLDKKGFTSKVLNKITCKINCSLRDPPNLTDIVSDLDDNNTTNEKNAKVNDTANDAREKREVKVWHVKNVLRNIEVYVIKDGKRMLCRSCKEVFEIDGDLANGNIRVEKADEYLKQLKEIAEHCFDHDLRERKEPD